MTRKRSFSRRAVLSGIGAASLGTVVPTVAVRAAGDDSSESDLAAAIETGVLEGAERVQEQNVQVTQEQLQATADGIAAAVSRSQHVSVEQVQAVATGATEGALLQNQYVDVEQIQAAASGATEGACTVQVQTVTVEQYQFASAYGAADALYDHHDDDADTVYDAAKECATEEIHYYEKHVTKTRKTKVTVEKRERVAVEVDEGPTGHEDSKRKEPKKKRPKRKSESKKKGSKTKSGSKSKKKKPKKNSKHDSKGKKKGAKKGSKKKSGKESKKGSKKKEPGQGTKAEQSQSVEVSQSQSADTGKRGSVDQSQSVTVDQKQSSSGGSSTRQSQSVDVSQSQSVDTDDEDE